MHAKKTDYLWFFLLGAFWGGSYVGIKYVVRDFPPVFGAMLRIGLAFLVFCAVFLFEKRNLKVSFRVRWRMWLTGILSQALPFSLLFWGERRISAGLAGILNGTVPLWTFLLGFFIVRTESFSGRKIGGLLLGILGLGVIFRPLIEFGGSRSEIMGTVAVVLMAVSYAAGSLMNKALLSGVKVDFRANLFHQHCGSFAFVLAAAFLLEPWPSLKTVLSSGTALAGTAYLGIFSTVIAWLIFYHLIREWGAVRASTVTYLAPVMGLLWAYLFFGEIPRSSESLGVLLILSGVVLLNAPVRFRAAPAAVGRVQVG